MDYLVSFLEGIVTFISPCLLPMLPIYLAYFAGNGMQQVEVGDVPAEFPTAGAAQRESSDHRTFVNALGFVLGFTLLFVALGALSGTLGSFITHNRTAFDIVAGIIVIVFGLDFMGVIHIGVLDRALKPKGQVHVLGFPSAVLFGMVFAIGWTPCVGVFLGSALLLAAQQGSTLQGVVMLLCYSLGLGVPFLLAAVIVGKLEGAFAAIKRHYRAVNLVCGGMLVLVGVLMACGLMGTWVSALSI